MADQSPTNNQQQSDEVKKLVAETALITAQAEKAKAEKELLVQQRTKFTAEAGDNSALKAITDAKALVDARKDLTAAQFAELKGQFLPFAASANLTAPTGGVTVSSDATGGFVEVEILGQQAVRKVAKLLTNDLAQLFDGLNKIPNGSHKNPKIGTLIIYNSTDIPALSAYSAVFQELEGFNLEFEQIRANATDKIAAAKNLLNLHTESASVGDGGAPMMDMGLGLAIAAAPTIATGIVKSIAELVNLFRTETEIKNKTLTVTEDFIVSCLVNNLPDVTVYYPSLYPPMLPDAGEKTKLALVFSALRTNADAARRAMEQIDSVSGEVVSAQNKTQAALVLKQSEIVAKEAALKAETDADKHAVLDAELKEMRSEQSALESRPSLSQALIDLNEAKGKLDFLVTTAASIITGLETPDATTKNTPLVKLLGIARLHELINTAGTYTLRFTATASGATTIRKNFFWNAKVLHTAGANLVYQLFDNQGRIARANALQAYLDSKTSAEVLAMTDSGEQIKTLDSRLANLNQIGGANTKLLNAAKTP